MNRVFRTFGWLLCAAVAATLAGCVNEAKEVAKYRKIVETPGQSVPVFVPGQPLSLEDALLLANRHNEAIDLQGEAYLQALIAKDRAASNFLPTLTLGPTYSNSDKSSSTGNVSTERTDVPANARMNVFNGFIDAANFRAAGRTIQQQRALLLDAQATVLIDVASTYYQILRSEQSARVLRDSVKVQEERVRDMRIRRENGLARVLDVVQTESQAANTRALLVVAANDIANGRATLSYLIGVPVKNSPLMDEARVPTTLPAVRELQTTAEQSRQDLAADRAAIEAAKFAVQAAIGQYFPSVSINFNYYLSRESAPTDSEWNALISANLPIFSAGVIEANVRDAFSRLRQAKLVESQTRRQIMQQVEQAYNNVLASRETIRELEIQVRAAAEAVTQAQEQYAVGTATNLEWLTAQDAYRSAQLLLASERFNSKLSYLSLLRAMGTLSTRLPWERTPTTMPTTQPAGATIMPAKLTIAPAIP